VACLLLLGSWKGLADVAALLHSEHAVTLVHRSDEIARTEGAGFNLLLAEAEDGAALAAAAAMAKRLAVSWLACCTNSDPAVTAAAYGAGALAVLPCDVPPEIVQQTISRLLTTWSPGGRGSQTTAAYRWRRHYRARERILLNPDSALEVEAGIVALTVIHADGTEVLLGLYGPGQILAGHPEDACCIQLYAHTDTAIRIQPWTEAVRQPDLADRLRERLRLMEAWAAMQARPQIEQRLLGILSLLAEQFGRPVPRGTRIEVRITHAQLASAVGATRSTVSRLLGDLRRRGALLSDGSAQNDRRYCLRHREGTFSFETRNELRRRRG